MKMEKQEKTYFNGKLERTMNGEEQWEKKGKSGTCRQCGQYIKNGESYYLVLTNAPGTIQDFPKEQNFIVHKKEFDILHEVTGSEDRTVFNILAFNRPVAKNGTKVDKEVVERFKAICSRRGFYITNETKNAISFKTGVREKQNFKFDKRFHTLEYTGRGLNGLFDRLYLNEFLSRVREELFNQEPQFRVEDAVKQATDQTHTILGLRS